MPVLKVGACNVTATRVTQKSNPVVLHSEHGYVTEELDLTETYPLAMVIFIDPSHSHEKKRLRVLLHLIGLVKKNNV